ncbi:hypothetical protein [Hansschlegelia sp. KR7-227]|uniref:hypothetical protein n=1 Tax=Hansschlegelia sp. KR7-227 TaxID=3400914 RepID=UPI003BFF46D3
MGDAAGRPVRHAAFVAGVWCAIALIGLSVVGMAHARSVQGHAETAFWIVVALVAAAAGWTALAFARAPVATRAGRVVQRVAASLMALAVVLFLWETIVVGGGLGYPPAPTSLLAR